MNYTTVISVFSIAGLLLSSLSFSPPVSAFSDVTTSTPYFNAIADFEASGTIEGVGDGTFRPNDTITRAAFMKVVLEGQDSGEEFVGEECFKDVGKQWFAKYVCSGKDKGYVSGQGDGEFFMPGDAISFVEASKVMAKAYDQEVVEHGQDWFHGFVKALEGSKAIPESIDALDRKITRAEMVEMMWRLANGKTDQPTKTLLGIKHPEIGIDLSAEKPQKATSCVDLRAFAEESMQGWYNKQYAMEDAIAMPMARQAMPAMAEAGMALSSPTDDGGGFADADFSETNVQVEGVDEADIVKTDGEYIYTARNNTVTIVKATPPSALEVVSTITEGNHTFSAQELYLDGDRLIVLGTGWEETAVPEKPIGISALTRIASPVDYIYPVGRQRTQVRIYDISDRSDPELDRKVTFDGWKVSSRRIGDMLYLVMNQNLHWWGGPMPLAAEAKADTLLPQFSDSSNGGLDRAVVNCDQVTILPRIPNPQYLVVAAIPTNNKNREVKREVMVGNGDNVYMSRKNLYVANTNWNYVWRAGGSSSSEHTNVYRFKVSEDGLEFKAQGAAPGRILNQFSMDEHDDTFRIATTKSQNWQTDTPSTNNLYVFNLDMEQVGEIEGIAPGETIYSTRFMGDRTYMVTFKKVDPFFVIDTSDPRNPKILGKLKLPGYSDYLHPYDDDHVLGFGKDAIAAKDGDFAWYQGMKIALFDVSDVSNPTLKHEVGLGDRGTSSPLLHNHKALLFEKEIDLLSFPVTIHEIEESQKTGENADSAWGQPTFQGAYVYRLTLNKGFELMGKITHYSDEDLLKSGSYFYGKNVDRVLRIDNNIYTVGEAGIQAHALWQMAKQGNVEFEKAKDDWGSIEPGIFWDE